MVHAELAVASAVLAAVSALVAVASPDVAVVSAAVAVDRLSGADVSAACAVSTAELSVARLAPTRPPSLSRLPWVSWLSNALRSTPRLDSNWLIDGSESPPMTTDLVASV